MLNKAKQKSETPPGCIELERQTKHLGSRWEWVKPEIWSNNMLEALVNGVKGGKWFSLIDKVYAPKTLMIAWEQVRNNKGAAGIDGVSIKRFELNAELYLKELSLEIKENRYIPQDVKRVYIPKGVGKTRPLGIPVVKDRIVQTAVKLVIEPIFENEFISSSYGFRPGKSAKDALREVNDLIERGYIHYVDADLQSYFDTICHDKLMEKLRKRIADSRVLRIIESWLKQDIMEGSKSWTPTMGSPQGAVISPLLANIYLHDFDKAITESGIKMVRFADDFVILTKSEEQAKAVLKGVIKWMDKENLIIHPEKTHTGNCMIEGQGFDFLGYRFENGKRWIRKKSIQKFRDRIRELTKRTNGQSIHTTVKRLNSTLKGWYNYFKHVSKWSLNTFDTFVRRRLRAILRKQEKRPGFGLCPRDHMRWNLAYFAKLGLFATESARQKELKLLKN